MGWEEIIAYINETFEESECGVEFTNKQDKIVRVGILAEGFEDYLGTEYDLVVTDMDSLKDSGVLEKVSTLTTVLYIKPRVSGDPKADIGINSLMFRNVGTRSVAYALTVDQLYKGEDIGTLSQADSSMNNLYIRKECYGPTMTRLWNVGAVKKIAPETYQLTYSDRFNEYRPTYREIASFVNATYSVHILCDIVATYRISWESASREEMCNHVKQIQSKKYPEGIKKILRRDYSRIIKKK